MSESQRPILECKKISKTFPGVKALDRVDFTIKRGEVHGLVGENGAGKSTLMKIISGVYSYDDVSRNGDMGIFYEGSEIDLKTPSDAIDRKIMTIHQELNVAQHLDVTANIFLNHELRNGIGLLDRRQMVQEVEELIDRFGVEMDPRDTVGNLSVDKQKMVEILRALSQDAKILILDEPTSFLTDHQTEALLHVVRAIRDQGLGIVFISHNIGEVLSLSDRVTVLRDGTKVGELDSSRAETDQVVRLMVEDAEKLDLASAGRQKQESDSPERNVLLEVRNLSAGKIRDANFLLHEGEVLGVTGLVGAGGTELAKTIFGHEEHRIDSGEMYLEGQRITIDSTSDAVANGIALLTKDRKNEGLFVSFSLVANLTMPTLDRFRNRLGLLDKRRQIKVSQGYVHRLQIKTPGVENPVEALSGGNQQKVVISKWLNLDPKVLIVDEPTTGIDVGAKSEVRKIIQELADDGKGVILITSEFEELEMMCDRVLVMFKGRIVAELTGAQIDRKEIRKHTSGGI